MRIDRLDDQPAADRRGPDEQPEIPNGPARLPITPDSPGSAGSRETKARAEFNAEYRATVEAVYRQDAVDRGYERIRETEENVVTPAMHRIEAEDPDRRLVGLEFRLKDKDRLTEKVNKAVDERGRTVEEALMSVKDAIRYTFQYPDESYTKGVDADCARLKEAGFAPVDRQGTWEDEEYKGINSRWREPKSGLLLEVQFHTQASYEAKQETHSAYERLRQTNVELPDEEIRELRAYQRAVSAKVPIPPGATEIPDYNYL